MITRRFCSALAVLGAALALNLAAADAPASAAKPGYTVVLELQLTESGTVEDAKIVSSDDTSVDHILDRMAMEAARGTKLPPKLKDGKAVKFKARAPFVFTVEDDEGPDTFTGIKPTIRSAVQPVYPEALAAKGEVGGAILEVVIGADGQVTNIKSLRASHPEFEQAAIAAVNRWVFNPARKDGAAIESRWRVAIGFETDVQRADWKWRFTPRPALGSYSVVHRTLPDEPVAVPPTAAPAEKPAAK